MKKILLLSLLTFFSGTIISCDEADNEPSEVVLATVNDLAADPTTGRDPETGQPISAGVPGYFNLNTGAEVPASAITNDNWDISFAGSTISVNTAGGAGIVMVDGIVDESHTAPENGYGESITDWYDYTGEAPGLPPHALLPKSGKVLIVRTTQGTYAKLNIISYYLGNPDTTTEAFVNIRTRPASRYYTFIYGVQTDGSRSL